MTVSGFPLYNTLTVTVKGVPARAVDGAVKVSVAWVVAQAHVTDVRAKPNAHDHREKSTLVRLGQPASADTLISNVARMGLF